MYKYKNKYTDKVGIKTERKLKWSSLWAAEFGIFVFLVLLFGIFSIFYNEKCLKISTKSREFVNTSTLSPFSLVWVSKNNNNKKKTIHNSNSPDVKNPRSSLATSSPIPLTGCLSALGAPWLAFYRWVSRSNTGNGVGNPRLSPRPRLPYGKALAWVSAEHQRTPLRSPALGLRLPICKMGSGGFAGWGVGGGDAWGRAVGGRVRR